MPTTFEHIQSTHIKDCFQEALQGFPHLQQHHIVVRKRRMEKTTMRAQPIINRFFFNLRRRHYRIDMTDNMHLDEQILVHELPRDVLVGWLAHELGHIVDYQKRTGWNMMKFGLGYILFPNFRIGAERKADIYAIDRGFAEQIIATKKFILEKSSLPNAYKKRIELYYMSADEVALMVQEKGREDLRMDKLF